MDYVFNLIAMLNYKKVEIQGHISILALLVFLNFIPILLLQPFLKFDISTATILTKCLLLEIHDVNVKFSFFRFFFIFS